MEVIMWHEDPLLVQIASHSPSLFTSLAQYEYKEVYCCEPISHLLREPDLTDLYLSDAIRERPSSLLTHEEEVYLSQAIELGRLAETELRERPTSHYRRHMLQSLVHQAHSAKETLITRNLRLVVSIAKKFIGSGMDLLDIIQEGNAGLIKAVEKYDWRKGTRFSTYATWWIRQEITRALDKHSRTIRIPTHMCSCANRLPRVRSELISKLNRDPTDDELAKALGISREQLCSLYNGIRPHYSLESSVSNDDGTGMCRIELIQDRSAENVDVAVEKSILHQELNDALDCLTSKEKIVIERRYGLNGCRTSFSQRIISNLLQISKSQVQRLERSALKKLRDPSILDRLF
jgi:RNA polymerase primary sigma factor